MTRSGRMRFMIFSVAVVSTVMVVGSRWIGGDGPRARARGDHSLSGSQTRAGLVGGKAPDLSFYKALEQSKPASGGAADDLSENPSRDVAGGAYVVQALVTRDRQKANRFRESLAALNLPVRISEGVVNGETVYRVRVGRYRDRSVAEIVSEKIRSSQGLDPWILRETN